MVVRMNGWAVKGWLATISELPPAIKNLGTDCFGNQPQRVTLFLDKQYFSTIGVLLLTNFSQI